jgi:molybdopterin-guanine dinucleotide biosynthesis protein A
MGEDKGGLRYQRRPQAIRVAELLTEYCEHVFVSVNAVQQSQPPYRELDTIVDSKSEQGPSAGILAAGEAHPGVAWLVTAVDLPLLDEHTLATLIAARDSRFASTAFQHEDGTIEPLCAIWEPSALAVLAERVSSGDRSPRRCLEAVDTKFLPCPTPRALISIDSRDEREAVLGEFEA